MKLLYRNGLLFTSIIIKYHGKSVEIDDVVVDTGASSCIIDPSAIENLQMTFTKEDEIETFYGVSGLFNYFKRTADIIILDDISINNLDFYVGTIDDNINGLIGLDLLINLNAIINLKKMEICFE